MLVPQDDGYRSLLVDLEGMIEEKNLLNAFLVTTYLERIQVPCSSVHTKLKTVAIGDDGPCDMLQSVELFAGTN